MRHLASPCTARLSRPASGPSADSQGSQVLSASLRPGPSLVRSSDSGDGSPGDPQMNPVTEAQNKGSPSVPPVHPSTHTVMCYSVRRGTGKETRSLPYGLAAQLGRQRAVITAPALLSTLNCSACKRRTPALPVLALQSTCRVARRPSAQERAPPFCHLEPIWTR